MKKVRRDIANSLNSNVLWLAADGMWALMESLWMPDDPTGFDLFTGNDFALRFGNMCSATTTGMPRFSLVNWPMPQLNRFRADG